MPIDETQSQEEQLAEQARIENIRTTIVSNQVIQQLIVKDSLSTFELRQLASASSFLSWGTGGVVRQGIQIPTAGLDGEAHSKMIAQ